MLSCDASFTRSRDICIYPLQPQPIWQLARGVLPGPLDLHGIEKDERHPVQPTLEMYAYMLYPVLETSVLPTRSQSQDEDGPFHNCSIAPHFLFTFLQIVLQSLCVSCTNGCKFVKFLCHFSVKWYYMFTSMRNWYCHKQRQGDDTDICYFRCHYVVLLLLLMPLQDVLT